MGFFRQEYWSGLLYPPPGDLPDPGIKPVSLMSPALAGEFFTTEQPGKPYLIFILFFCIIIVTSRHSLLIYVSLTSSRWKDEW